MNKKIIFLALDTKNVNYVKKIISQSKNNKIKIIPKFGLQFFYSKNGRRFLEKFKNDFWLDLKIHASGGYKMLNQIKKKTKKINKNLKILGVTILTSLDNKALKKIGYSKNLDKIILRQADLIKKSGCDGLICSAHEAKIIRKRYKNFLIITPGIRLPGDESYDQSRIMSPKEAFENKVSGIVMGRSLTKGNYKKNLKKLLSNLK